MGKTRLWAFAAVAWTAFYVVLYVVIARRDGNGVAWWYATLVGAAGVLILAAGIEGGSQRARTAMLAALILLVFSGLLGLATIGFLLIPSIAATGIAIGAMNREPSGSA